MILLVHMQVKKRRFDISNIDFGRLQQEFARVKNKNLLMNDLQDMIDARLEMMMKRDLAHRLL